MTEKPYPLRLADVLDRSVLAACHDAAAELRRLHAEVEECDALRDRMADLLRSTAVALKGPEPPLTSWGWEDLPEHAARLQVVNQQLLEALEFIPASGSMLGAQAETKRIAAIAAAKEKE